MFKCYYYHFFKFLVGTDLPKCQEAIRPGNPDVHVLSDQNIFRCLVHQGASLQYGFCVFVCDHFVVFFDGQSFPNPFKIFGFLRVPEVSLGFHRVPLGFCHTFCCLHSYCQLLPNPLEIFFDSLEWH